MLFNSYEFVFFFLTTTLFVFYGIGLRGHHRIAIAWLVIASLFFYGWWNPAYLGLILGSMLFNYAAGVALTSRSDDKRSWSNRGILTFGVAVNLGLLGYFKYANFFVGNVNLILDTQFHLEKIILPLAISFFTFQQIAYLADAYKGETREYNFLHYCLFVTFFPQLIAGPIVHHKEMLPQFARDTIYRFKADNLSIGLTIFLIGLFKKVVIADGVAVYGTPVFAAAADGQILSFLEAWCGALAYTFQLYFDFSGYSDMAIGLARLFGIRIPLNFHSPYKAVNIIDFWRRWHMTLSRFLRDYLYIPLGGNRHGVMSRYRNLIITMLLGGLWHGAGWTFVIWGGLHGVYLVINHAWHALRRALGHDLSRTVWWGRGLARLLTFLAVIVGWVFFRADNLDTAIAILKGMCGLNGVVLPEMYLGHINRLSSLGAWLIDHGVRFEPLPYFGSINTVILLIVLFLVAFFLPNTQQVMDKYKPAFESHRIDNDDALAQRIKWQPSYLWAAFTSIIGILSIVKMNSVSEFLYFQF